MATKHASSEIRLTRLYDAPVRAVWDAWTIPEQVEKWWGPRGFTLTTHSKDLRAGGSWRYTMHGPDGTDYPNVTKYLVVEPCQKLVYDHGGTDERPPLFRVAVTFTEENGRTTMEMVSTLPSPEAAREMAKLIQQAGGNATWDRLAEHIEQATTGKPTFVMNRSFDAPIARVFEMWTNPGHLAEWLPPSGSEFTLVRSVTEPDKPKCFVFAGKHHTLRTSVALAEEAPDRTRVTVTTEPESAKTQSATSPNEFAAFASERASMTLGWKASFDVLEALLAPAEPTV